jgi:hypothetical protein
MHSPVAFLLAIILALPIAVAPQAQEKSPPQEKTKCGTVIPPEQLKVEMARRKAIAATEIDPPTQDPYYLPMTIHITHPSNGAGDFTLDELAIAMRDLNRMWQPVGIQFFIYGEIDHIYNDIYYHIPNEKAKRDALRQVNVVPNTINVYFTYLDPMCGQSTFTGDPIQGVLISIGCAGVANNPSTFAHEVGHYLDLYHTHETAMGFECPSGNNCETAGDLLCDTPADPDQSLWGWKWWTPCGYFEPAPTPAVCDMTAYNPPTRNLMSYARASCVSEFTSQQIARALGTLRNANNRKNLINSGKFYVDPLASDSNTQCTPTAPCRTVEKAVQAARDGAFIYLKPGIHPASSVSGKKLTLMRWGTPGVAELKP